MIGYSGYQHLNIEPAEERAAYKIVVGSDQQLRDKSIDELIKLNGKVQAFGLHTPGMMSAGIDAGIRIDHALKAKQGS